MYSRDKQYSAHRAIVCPQSPVIAGGCRFQDTSEGLACDSQGTSSKYHFNSLDDDPQAVDCLVQYLYRQDYQSNYRGLATKDARAGDVENKVSTSPEHDNVDDSLLFILRSSAG
jgi:hypothetical protein